MNKNQDAAPVLREKLPEHAAHLAAVPELADAWNHELVERRAQAAKVESLLAYKARRLEANQGQHSFIRRAVEKAVTRDAATALGLTEATVRRLIGTAEFLTEKMPKTWETYRTGAIDRDSAAKAAAAVEDITHRKDLLPVIDTEIAERAPGENAAAVQKWVPQRVAELDTIGFQERYDRAQAKRYVTFRHFGNGMSRIDALIPTLVAAEVEQRIHSEARNAPRFAPKTPESEDEPQERTLSQRVTDAFIHRLEAGSLAVDPAAAGKNGNAPNQHHWSVTGPAGPTNLKIGILVPVQTLTGESDAPAISWDRTWSLPAGTARQIALDPAAEHDWYIVGTTETATSACPETRTDRNGEPASASVPQILTVMHPRKGPGAHSLDEWIAGADPETGNLLTKTYQSRTSRDRQRDAILIRDGQCTQPNCTNPGWEAEIDHTQSFETGGDTAGHNLRVLCRDCHSIKSHRLDRTTQYNSRQGGAEPALHKGTQHDSQPQSSTRGSGPARASPDVDDLPDWLIETRPPPDWVVGDAA